MGPGGGIGAGDEGRADDTVGGAEEDIIGVVGVVVGDILDFSVEGADTEEAGDGTVTAEPCAVIGAGFDEDIVGAVSVEVARADDFDTTFGAAEVAPGDGAVFTDQVRANIAAGGMGNDHIGGAVAVDIAEGVDLPFGTEALNGGEGTIGIEAEVAVSGTEEEIGDTVGVEIAETDLHQGVFGGENTIESGDRAGVIGGVNADVFGGWAVDVDIGCFFTGNGVTLAEDLEVAAQGGEVLPDDGLVGLDFPAAGGTEGRMIGIAEGQDDFRGGGVFDDRRSRRRTDGQREYAVREAVQRVGGVAIDQRVADFERAEFGVGGLDRDGLVEARRAVGERVLARRLIGLDGDGVNRAGVGDAVEVGDEFFYSQIKKR